MRSSPSVARSFAFGLALALAFVVHPVSAQLLGDAPEKEAEADPVPAPAPKGAPKPSPRLTDPEIDRDELTLLLIPLSAEEIEKLAGDWLAIVRAKTAAVVEEQIKINRTQADAVEQAARDRLTQLTEERRALFDKYATVVDAWELKGGKPEAIAGYRAYRNSIIVEETRNTDWRTLLAQAVAWTTHEDGGLRVAKNVAVVLFSMLGLLAVAGVVRRLVRRWVGHIPNFSKLLQGFVALVAYWITLTVGLMLVLAGLGVDVTPLFALIGGASFILAFAMQDTLGNLAAGLLIMMNRPFDEGDVVDIGGVAGTVKRVSIVSTTVVTPDNRIVVVPNSSVWGNVITNSTASDTRRVDLAFAVSADTPIARAQEEPERTVRAHPLVLDEPEPVIRVNALTDAGVEFIVRPWAHSGDYWTVYWDLTRDVKEALDRAGMAEPAPEPEAPEPDAATQPA